MSSSRCVQHNNKLSHASKGLLLTNVRPFIADEQVFAPFPEAVANDRWHVVCYSGYVRMPRRVLAQLGGGGGGGGGGAIPCYRVLAQLSLRFAWLLAALAIACQLS